MPTKKVGYGLAINALIGLVAWGLGEFADVTIPAQIQGMIHTLAVFGVQWWVTDTPR